jgi:hypothetical protein
MQQKKPIDLTISEGDPYIGYIRLPAHPRTDASGVVARTIRLHDLVGPYDGPELNLDFDHEGVLIGIEILGDAPEDADD